MATSDVVCNSSRHRICARHTVSWLIRSRYKVNGKEMNRYNEEREEMAGEGLFSFDEDMLPEKEADSLNEGSSALDLFCDIQSDDSGNFDMSQAHLTFSGGSAGIKTGHPENPWVEEKGLVDLFSNIVLEFNAIQFRSCSCAFGLLPIVTSTASKSSVPDLHTNSVEMEEDVEAEAIRKTESLAYGCSLPITIPSGRFWPPRNVVDRNEGNEMLDFDENCEVIDKTILPQRPPKDPFSQMRAQARSIQAIDNPERLFAELPSRRRYETGQGWFTSQVTAPMQIYSESVTAAVEVVPFVEYIIFSWDFLNGNVEWIFVETGDISKFQEHTGS
ncbi:unnamed protein product [Brugia pahangi]|uniref:Protein aurora borealis n=1 Tax=Brugia pahangi TaxID=6280 RepID=A0A0N4SY98_BRUPA|nr:unnamed protein product [Brugia pahangi]